MSTKSTVAPQYRAAFEDATNVFGDVQTISPLPTSNAIKAICKADVALFTATA